MRGSVVLSGLVPGTQSTVSTPNQRPREWYSVSASAVRRFMIMVVAFALPFVGLAFYKSWENRTLAREAWEAIEAAGRLAERVQEEVPGARSEHGEAWEMLDRARSLYNASSFGDAFDIAERSRAIFASILNLPGDEPGSGAIRFLSVQGGVEYRRGDRGAWKRARNQDTVDPGDWVKTSGDGTAELLFSNGDLFTIRPDTMIQVGGRSEGEREERQTRVAFGVVGLDTGDSGSEVLTPRSEARVAPESAAQIGFDRDREEAQFIAYSGGIEIQSANGQVRTVGALQRVVQQGDLLQEAEAIPTAPRPLAPRSEIEIDFDREKEVRLEWEAVANADRYALEVSRSRLFATAIVETDSRRKPYARLGIRGEGSFYWRVAAIDDEGIRGAWSDPATFRIASRKGVGAVDDATPPDLEINDWDTYGSVVMVNGRTEPGSTVQINGETVALKLDGTFSKPVQMTDEGWGFIEVSSSDAWGNTSNKRIRVFIDSF